MEHVVQFDNKRGTLPGLDILRTPAKVGGAQFTGSLETGAAWLSSARVVRCRVKSFNERNPYSMLNIHRELPRLTGRKAGMTSNQHGSYALGHTRATMASTKGR